MGRLSRRKESELRLIADLTLEATLAAEDKLSKLAPETRASARASTGAVAT